MADVLTEPAFAKVNLTLRVLRRRADGYHDLDSLVVFADLADRLTLSPGSGLALTVHGPTAGASGPIADNLVLKAAHALAARIPSLQLGAFVLEKRLPVAAGLGGGSADAAAALRLLARANGIPLDDPRLHEAARATGADVPVCLDPRARRMGGIGELLSAPLALKPLPAVLVNPRAASPTPAVFAALGLAKGQASGLTAFAEPLEGDAAAALAKGRNDMQASAARLTPAIAETLALLEEAGGARLVRMSGSGATCFALYADRHAAARAARWLKRRRPPWWVR
ncbi:MAG TPA: 4-(cytidine 5'-diphospho)-2-C-methyl-D-erythritol kinase, partial [Thermomicrobiales bacterium]|nr:4-(cytidine 5'-diphospho)-2-C-methyl-D-erythritol kinase [Thermomicrobiales bacterium]